MQEFPKEYFEWVEAHKSEDPFKLRLKYLGNDNNPDWIVLAIDQIEILRKANIKLSDEEEYHQPEVLAPKFAVEQCSSFSTAKLHEKIISDFFNRTRISIVDLTCGLGIDAMCFAKAGMDVTAIEKNPLQADIARFNFRNCKNVKIIEGDCIEYLNTTPRKFDAAFVDPARRDSSGKRFYSITDCTPDLKELIPLMKERVKFCLAKLSPMIDITETLFKLPEITSVHVVGVKDECKELLAEFDFTKTDSLDATEKLITINDLTNNTIFSYTRAEEKLLAKEQHFGIGGAGDYLYYPSAAIMKGGCYASVALKYDLAVASKSSHIYFSSRLKSEFPGRIYLIESVYPFSNDTIKKLSGMLEEADVTARNFTLTSEQLSRKLKLKPGKSNHIFATTDVNGKRWLFVTKLI